MLKNNFKLVISDQVRKVLVTNHVFRAQLKKYAIDVDQDYKPMVKKLIINARAFLTSTASSEFVNLENYKVKEIVSTACQEGFSIFSLITGRHETFCGKLGPRHKMKDELKMAKLVTGPCVVSVVDFAEVGESKSILITPLYCGTIRDIISRDQRVPEIYLVELLLSGLSGIYSFACKGFEF